MKFLAGVGVVLLAITSVVLIRTMTLQTKQVDVPTAERVKINEASAIEHLSRAVRIKTISFDDPLRNDYRNLIALRDFIDTEFPLIHKNFKRTIINNYSLLFEWKGTDTKKKPVILTAHMDVVPVEPSEWKHAPFSGELIEGVIWGRGTLDDKGSLFSILEAAESLLKKGFTPERTIYFGFGHDEEAGTTGGIQGARNIAEYLKEKGIHAESVLDEGGVIADERLSFLKGKKLALIGVAEKGFVTLKITASGQSGHSMMPPKDTAILLLAKAILALDKNKMASSLNGVIGLTFDYLAPEMPFVEKMLFANRWLFSPLIQSVLEKDNFIAAMMHTTVAPTMIQGGVKEQSLPSSASVIINFRILPGETSRDVINHVTRSMNDQRVKVEPYGTVIHEPILLSGLHGKGYQEIDRTLREIFPGVLVAPILITGRTDSLYYRDVADNLYRFAPYLYSPGDDKRPHGTDEFIKVDSYLNMIQFYIRYIENSAGHVLSK